MANLTAEVWLINRIRTSPRPLPLGRFPHMLKEGERIGYRSDALLDILDTWLEFGYCRIVDPITQDIEISEAGEKYFFQR